MNILIIKPNTLRPEDRQGHFSSLLLGMLSIATYVNAPDRLRLAVYPEDMQHITDSLPWADAVGISAFTSEYELARRLVRRLKELYPEKIFFLGGYHGTLLGDCDRTLFNFMVTGEGEKPVNDLITEKIRHGRHDPFAVYRADSLLSADELPAVDYRLYPNLKRITGGRISLIGSRGCRYRACRFCTSSRFHSGLRRMPPAALADHFAQAISVTSPSGINLWDDNLSDNEDYLSALADALHRRNVQPRQMSGFVRMTSAMPSSVFDLLQRMGFTSLVTGLESGSNRVLRYLKGRQSNTAFSRENLIRAREHGMNVLASFIMGSPTETREEMAETVQLLEWIRDEQIPATVWIYVASPLPGTPLWDIARERGNVSTDMNFDCLAFDHHAHPLLLEPGIDMADFLQILGRATAIADEISSNASVFAVN